MGVLLLDLGVLLLDPFFQDSYLRSEDIWAVRIVSAIIDVGIISSAIDYDARIAIANGPRPGQCPC